MDEDDDGIVNGGKPEVIPYPLPGANCRRTESLVQKYHRELPDCPEDDDEKVNGANAVAHPAPGANCRRTEALVQK